MSKNLDHLPLVCASRDPLTNNPIWLKRGETGYCLAPETLAPEMWNMVNEITVEQVDKMMQGSMFGWDIPAVAK